MGMLRIWPDWISGLNLEIGYIARSNRNNIVVDYYTKPQDRSLSLYDNVPERMLILLPNISLEQSPSRPCGAARALLSSVVMLRDRRLSRR